MLVIWNGQAGGGDAEQQSLVRERLADHDVDVEIFESASEEDARDRVRGALGDGLAAIVAAGGDGTVRPIALELIGGDTPLGILPLGTAMNVARALELPLELEAAVDVLATGRPRPIDVGVTNGTPFLEVASIGLTADVLAGATAVDRGRWGVAVELIRRAWRQPRTRITLTLDGREVRTHGYSLVVANGPYTGRAMQIAPDARLDDGLLDVVVFRGFSPWRLALHLVGIVFGRRSDPRIHTYRARSIRVESRRPLSVRADSHDLGTTPADLACRASAVRIVAAG